ncbi:MAG TPA: hypothetical protein VF736_05775 [Pyrinomonadaceae bacterium]
MLALAYIANLGYNIDEGDCRAAGEISNLIVGQLNSQEIVKGDWQLVWGPYVYKFPLIARFRDNTFYVVRNTQDPSRYAVAIAGTNPCELWDWVLEDFMVGHMTHWAYGHAPSAAKISAAAALSLSILQNAVPCPGLPGAGLHLKDFLREAVAGSGGGVSVAVTGHSLGGEMASTAALWLADTQGGQAVRSEVWDPDGKATVSACCFAGPTAGNRHWAAYYDSRLGERTCRVWNSMDIVPHAWNTGDLSELPDLYRTGGVKMGLSLKLLVEGIRLKLELARNDYTQIIEGQPPLDGKVNTSLPDSYFDQAAYQHVEAYLDLLGLPGLKGTTDCSAQKAGARQLP